MALLENWKQVIVLTPSSAESTPALASLTHVTLQPVFQS